MPHIGELVADRLKEVGMTKSEFARRIHLSPQAIPHLLQRCHFKLDELLLMGKVLDFNFLEAALEHVPERYWPKSPSSRVDAPPSNFIVVYIQQGGSNDSP